MSAAPNDFLNLISKSKQILIVIPPSPTDDVVCAAFGLSNLLEKQQKTVTLLNTETLPERLSFLTQRATVVNNLSGARDFIIIFSTKHNKILNVATEQKEEEYQIRVTPEHGSIDPRDFSFVPAEFKYDLVVVLGAASLDHLEKIYTDNTDLFFEVPKVNIDNQAANENFGQVNLVNMAFSSVSEIITEFSLEHFEKMIDKETAEAFLAGIIAATESFQKPNTTPSSMIMAARLMKYKADQPNIIRNLYKTKSLPFLKLWGRVMARLNWNDTHRAAWSLISIEDFVQSRTSEKDVPAALEQVQENFAKGQLFAIFYNESSSATTAQIRFSNENIARDIANLFNVSFHPRTLKLTFDNKNLLEAEKAFLEKLESL